MINNLTGKIINKILSEGLVKTTCRVFQKGINIFLRKLGSIKIIKKIDQAVEILLKNIIVYTVKVQENKIVFLTFQGSYTCNPKGIANEIIRQGLDYELIWDVKTDIPMSDYPLELKFVKHKTLEFYKHLASAKVIIENTNIMEGLHVHKKKEQYLLQTWHGSLGIKRLDGDVVMGKHWKRLAQSCQRKVNYCLSNSEFETEVFNTSYWNGVPALKTGHARNDIFFVSEEEKQRIRKKVYKALGISEEKKIFLFAPTHRDSVGEKYYSLDYEALQNVLGEKFGGEWQIVVRLHNRLKKKSKEWLKTAPEYVCDGTMYEDMQELLVATDVGLTDYSSWIFDYMLMKKPGFILELDHETFKSQRGFYYAIETTPFPIAENKNQLLENILQFDEERYKEEVDKFLIDKGCMEDGRASERIVEKIKEIIEKK